MSFVFNIIHIPCLRPNFFHCGGVDNSDGHCCIKYSSLIHTQPTHTPCMLVVLLFLSIAFLEGDTENYAHLSVVRRTTVITKVLRKRGQKVSGLEKLF